MEVTGKALANAVLYETPQEVARLCKDLRDGENSCKALGTACRFLGLEYVKALAENGATFKYHFNDDRQYAVFYWLALLDLNSQIRQSYFTDDYASFSNYLNLTDDNEDVIKTFKVLPIEQRVEIARYLCENSERLYFEPGELLFYSMINNTKEITSLLKGMGVKLLEKRIKVLTESTQFFMRWDFAAMTKRIEDEELVEIIDNITDELGGETIYVDDLYFWHSFDPYRQPFCVYQPDLFRYILKHYDHKKMVKTKIMKGAIDRDSVKCIEICAEHGWLRMPHKRDEMIEYASSHNSPECTAWLLEFKNRTADLEAERVKAEKKTERELNAAPNSAAVLKRIWGYELQEDGTLMITRYKGDRTEIAVPPMIGKRAVTAIGKYAFSPNGPRLTAEQKEFRKTIRRVALPEGIHSIGESAFRSCEGLTEFEIPNSVVEIGDFALSYCHGLTEIVIPETVVTLGGGMFYGCKSLSSVKLPKNMTVISENLFGCCKALRSITLHEGIRRIDSGAFGSCEALSEITIPIGISEIGTQAFSHCSKLTEIVIPDTVTKIGNGAFEWCTELRSVRLPESISEIGNYMFTRCEALQSIKLPAAVRSIKMGAFSGCASLERIDIPDKVTEIGELAFRSCTSLKYAVIPASVNKIINQPNPVSKPENIFQGCTNLTAVVEPNSLAERYCQRNGIKYIHKKTE